MHKIEFSAGQSIHSAAAQLCAAASEHGEAVGKFNDIELHAAAGDAPEGVISFYNEECERRSKAYRDSPVGKAAALKSDQECAALQAKHDRLMARLSSLDWSNDGAVLDWLCAMQEPSDRVGVIIKRNTIVSAFESHGFKANENCGPDYRDGDRANMFRYLVGQGIAGLKEGPAIHAILHKFVGEWRERFGVA